MYPTSVTPLPISPSHSYTRISPPRSPPSPHTARRQQGHFRLPLIKQSLNSSNKSGVRSLAQLKSFKQILGPQKTPLSYSRSQYDVSDIKGASPKATKPLLKESHFMDVSDIDGAHKKASLFERAKTRDMKLDISDIVGEKKKYSRKSPMNPLDPEYLVINEQGQARVDISKLANYGEIKGSKPKKFTHARNNPRDQDLSLRTNDIMGATPYGNLAKVNAMKSKPKEKRTILSLPQSPRDSAEYKQKIAIARQLMAQTPAPRSPNNSIFENSIQEELEQEVSPHERILASISRDGRKSSYNYSRNMGVYQSQTNSPRLPPIEKQKKGGLNLQLKKKLNKSREYSPYEIHQTVNQKLRPIDRRKVEELNTFKTTIHGKYGSRL